MTTTKKLTAALEELIHEGPVSESGIALLRDLVKRYGEGGVVHISHEGDVNVVRLEGGWTNADPGHYRIMKEEEET